MATKKEALARKIEWNTAIAEGRAVRYGNGPGYYRSFATKAEAGAFVATHNQGDGRTANIIDPSYAQAQYVTGAK